MKKVPDAFFSGSVGIGLVLAMSIFTPHAAAATIVTPNDPNGWGFLEETPTGSGTFVYGPSAPPLGGGSVQLTVNGTGGEIFGTFAYVGTRLDAITSLAYSTYRSSGSNALAPSLQLDIDTNVTDANTAWQGRLVYEPYYTHPVSTGVWQTWNPLDNAGTGNWWFTGAPGNAQCPITNPCTWTELHTKYPNAGIRSAGANTGAIQFKAGGGWTSGFVGNIDAFSIGVNNVVTTHDFELPFTVPTIASTSPSSQLSGGSAFTLTVTGTNFFPSSVVQWNGSSRPTTFASSTQLTAAISSSDIAAAAAAPVTVVNATPGGGSSNALSFVVTSLPATLHVIKSVVNVDGTAVPSDFLVHVKSGGVEVGGSPAFGTSTPGTAYSLPPGTYSVSEDANSSYTQNFGGACAPSGIVTLFASDDKICTLVNTENVSTPTPVVNTGGAGGPAVAVSLPKIVPLIGIVKVPTPLALPAGPGPVTYNYTVSNVGAQQALVNVTVTDDKCSRLTLLSGDTNGNQKLDPVEKWNYSCVTALATTTTNTATAIGYGDDSDHLTAIATAIATVIVGAPLAPPLITITKVPNRLTPFPFGGGPVTYTYTVTNPGTVAVHDVVVTDDKCSPVSPPSGDTSGDGLLDPGESWVYTCQSSVTVSTRNIGTVLGKANGLTAVGYAFAMVLVSSPGFPNTGSLKPSSSLVVGSSALNIRQSPSLGSPILGKASAQTQGTLINGDTIQKDGYTWMHIQYENGLTGWSVTTGLMGVASTSPQSIDSGFTIGDKVSTTREMNVRVAAGVREDILEREAAGTSGTLMSGPVQKDGYVWWKIRYSPTRAGWTAGTGLTKSP